MNEEKVLTLRGKKAVWAPGGGSGGVSSWNDLTDRPFGKGYSALLDEKNVKFWYNSRGENYYCTIPFLSGLVIGNKYTVIWDGVEYPDLVAFEDYPNVMLGADGETNADMPFSMGIDITVGISLEILTHDSKETHDVSILGETIRTIDAEYMPNGYPTKTEKKVFEFCINPNVPVNEQPVPAGYTRTQNDWGGWDFTANAVDVGLSFAIGNMEALIGAKWIDNNTNYYISQNQVFDGQFMNDYMQITSDGKVIVSTGVDGNGCPYNWYFAIKSFTFPVKKTFNVYEDAYSMDMQFSEIESLINDGAIVECRLHGSDGNTRVLQLCSANNSELKFYTPVANWDGVVMLYVSVWYDEFAINRYKLVLAES